MRVRLLICQPTVEVACMLFSPVLGEIACMNENLRLQMLQKHWCRLANAPNWGKRIPIWQFKLSMLTVRVADANQAKAPEPSKLAGAKYQKQQRLLKSAELHTAHSSPR